MKMDIGGTEKKVKMTGSHTMNERYDVELKTKTIHWSYTTSL